MAKLSIHEWFSKRKQERSEEYRSERLDIPGNLWIKCYKCSATIFSKDLSSNHKVCPKCNYHFRLSSAERVALLLDPDSFKELDPEMISTDFLDFTDSKPYAERIQGAMKKSTLKEAVTTGYGKLEGHAVAFGCMDFSFMGGSMGSVVGEKVARLIEYGLEHKVPVIMCTASGGARMQEGIMSLMQMAKTAAALGRLRENCIPYIVILTDPTTGGTTASFAMLGDVHIAEPSALIGFAGPRVIEQTIRQKLPAGFQRSEFLKEHGMLDVVCERKDLKKTLKKVLDFFNG